MKIQYASDLHLEFIDNREYLNQIAYDPKADYLLLAGDVLPFKMMNHLTSFINYLSNSFKAVYWIPGNHEYYGYDIGASHGSLCTNVRDNVFLVNNQVITIEDVNIICSTMWTHIGPENELRIQNGLNDFHQIRNNKKLLKINDYNLLHETDQAFIKKSVEQNKGKKTIVMTHHVPTFMNYPEQYKGDALQEAFAVELHDFIENSDVSYWIYGHHHNNIPPYKIGNTTMLTNQMGYVRANEHKTFQADAILKI